MSRLDALRAWLATKPHDRFALYSLALELKKAGDVAAAAEAFKNLLREHPATGAGHYQHGLLWDEAGDEDKAVAAWRAGLDALRGIDDPEARRSVGEIEAALAGYE